LGLPCPKTIYRLPEKNEYLTDYVDFLGGFPIVIKIVAGTLGVGTIIIESMRSLRSMVDYIRTTGDHFIMREYIKPKHLVRVCVLGSEIIASLKYAIRDDDFRGLPYIDGGTRMDFGEEVEELSRTATRLCEYDFTRVDIIIDHQDRPFILEVNPPSNFVAYERDMGIPIGDKIVQFLVSKSRESRQAIGS
jgi:glutathione synthase/RimK-type ligase-like ATP-grasp enzyme